VRSMLACVVQTAVLLLPVSVCFLISHPNIIGKWKATVANAASSSITLIDLVVTIGEEPTSVDRRKFHF